MSQRQAFANNHSTKLARIVSKLVRKHIPNNPQLTTAFNQFQHSMYVHRVLYKYHVSALPHTIHKPRMQAHLVRILRNNPQLLVNVAHTPTAHM